MRIIYRYWLLSCLAFVALPGLGGCEGLDLTPAEYVARAQDYIDKGELQPAVIELLNALQEEPNTLDARWLLAQVSVELGDGARAEKEVRRALALGLAPAAARATLVRAIFLQGHFDRVFAETAPLPAGMPKADQALALALRGQAYVATQRLEQAQESLKKALQVDSGSTVALVGVAMLHAVQRQYDEARGWLQRALDANSSSPEAWSLLGDIELAEANAAAADTAFGKAIDFRKYPTIDSAKRALTRVQLDRLADAETDIEDLKARGFDKHPYVNYVAGVIYFRQKKYAEAAQAFEASSTASRDYLPNELYLATTHLVLGNHEQALAVAERLQARAPQSLAARRLKGAVDLSRSEFDAAAETLKAVLRDAPQDTVALRMLATASLLKGDAQQGVEYYRKVVALKPESRQDQDMLTMAKLLAGQELNGSGAGTGATASGSGDPYAREFLYAADAFRNGKLGEALQRAQKLHEEYPDRVDPLNLMAACYLAAAQWDSAKAELEKVLALQPNEPSAARNLAKVEAQQGNLDRARSLLAGLVQAHPGDRDGVLMLAEIETRRGDQAAGAQVLEQALERSPEALAVRAQLAQHYFDEGRLAKVLEVTRDLNDRQLEQQPALLALRGKAQMLAGDAASARRSFERWSEIAPDSAEAHFLHGDTLARSGEIDGARAALTRAVRLDPKYLPARVGEVKMLAQTGDKREARAALANLKREFGDRPEVLGIEGWFALLDGEYAEAAERFSAAVEKRPNTELIIFLVRALWAQEEHEQALAVMQRWLTDHPNDLTVLLHLAGGYLTLNREEEARALYARVVELYPNHVPALNNLAWLSRHGDLKQAIAYAERANELVPNDAQILDTLGMLVLASGDADRGYGLIREAARLSPQDLEIQLHLGQALLQQENFTEAREVLAAIVGKAPDSQFATEARARLDSIAQP